LKTFVVKKRLENNQQLNVPIRISSEKLEQEKVKGFIEQLPDPLAEVGIQVFFLNKFKFLSLFLHFRQWIW